MAAAQTSAGRDGGGSSPRPVEHQPVTEFWFETPPTQDEVRDRLRQAERNRHTFHTQPVHLCPLCPTPSNGQDS